LEIPILEVSDPALISLLSVTLPSGVKLTRGFAPQPRGRFAIVEVVRGEYGPDSNINKTLGGLEKKGFALNISAYYDSPDAVKVAVAKGTGVGLLYEESIRPEVQRGTFKILNPAGLKLYSHSFIVYHKERPLSANASEFLKLLRRRKRHARRD